MELYEMGVLTKEQIGTDAPFAELHRQRCAFVVLHVGDDDVVGRDADPGRER